MKTNLTLGIAVVAIVIAIFALGSSGVSPVAPQIGGTTNFDDLTLGGGTLEVTTSNTATSTVIAGCYQFYATSTATAQKFQASTTPGIMYSSYGSCPNL